jgi:hypothetical protein
MNCSGRMRCGWRRCIGMGHLSIYIFFREDPVRLEKMYQHGSPIYCINCSGRLVRLEGVARWLYLTEIVSARVISLFYTLFREEVVRLEGYLRAGVPPTCPTLSSRGRERHQRRRFHAKRTRAKRDSPDTCLALAQVTAYAR